MCQFDELFLPRLNPISDTIFITFGSVLPVNNNEKLCRTSEANSTREIVFAYLRDQGLPFTGLRFKL